MKSIARKTISGLLFRSEVDRVLTCSMAFSIALIMVRVWFAGQLTFLFLVWNLFLAWIPYAITNWAQDRFHGSGRLPFALVSGLWLLFVPNSFYIITDLFHLGNYYTIPRWFDLAMILSFAWNGLLLGFLSVGQMQKMIGRYVSLRNEWLFIYPVMWLNAWGIYIGRYLRFNSWDIITNPFALFADICEMLMHPLQYKNAWGMITCYSVFMTLMYMAIRKIGKAVH